eukprot:6290163-Amphidinium_carterae.1
MKVLVRAPRSTEEGLPPLMRNWCMCCAVELQLSVEAKCGWCWVWAQEYELVAFGRRCNICFA